MHRHQLRPALHAVLVLLLAGTAPRAARAQDAPARSGAAPTAGTLIVELHGQEPATFAVAYTPASTAGELLARIAKHVGVSPDYLVVYTATGPSVDAAGRVVHRRASKRVGGYAPLPGGSAGVPPHLVGANTKLLSDLGIKDGDVLITYLRPLRGDHIHYAFAIYVGDLLVDTLWDTSVLGMPFSSEGKAWPQSFKDLSQGLNDYHIATTQPHFGIHSGQPYWFGDGLIHVHPGTSWAWFRATEGLGATLQTYLSQVGAAWYDTNSARYPVGMLHIPRGVAEPLSGNALVLPKAHAKRPYMAGGEYDCRILDPKYNGTIGGMLITNRSVPLESLSNVGAVRPYDMTDDKVVIASNATHRWRAYYWPYYLQQKPLVLEKGVGSLWLRDNLGMITLSFERRDRDPKASPPPRPPKCMVDALTAKRVLEGKPPVPNQQSQFYMLGFDGAAYPMPNAVPFLQAGKTPLQTGRPAALPPVFAQLLADLEKNGDPFL